MASSSYAIKTTGLTKEYGHLKAVNNLSIEINESEIFGLLGPNGAGKTTTVRLLTGMLKPTLGDGQVIGYDIRKDSDIIRENVGILTETSSLYERLSVRDNLNFFAKMYDIPKSEIKGRIEDIINLFELSDKIDEQAGALSKGMRQKVAIARAILHDPNLLFLDEPTSALAPESAKIVRDFIQTLSRQKHRTIFLNTHNLSEAEELCSRVGIIEKGILIALGSPNELRSILHDDIITVFRFKQWSNEIQDYFGSLNGNIINLDIQEKSLSIKLEKAEDQTPEIVKELVGKNLSIIEVKHVKPSLERIYLELVNGENKMKNMEETK